MLRGWLAHSCAAPSSRVSICSTPRLLSTCHGSPVLRAPTQQLHLQGGRHEVTCMAGFDIGRRYSPPADYHPASTFEELKLDDRLVKAVRAGGLDSPTEIQSLAVPAIMSGGDYLLAAQTGSGKTLAYLLPLIHLLKAQEGQPGWERKGKRPKIVILVPTKDLVEQITGVAKTLCHFAKFRVVPCSANQSMNQLARSLTAPLEMVVATPNRLGKVMKEGGVALGEVRWLVIDEADTMLEAGMGFTAEVSNLMSIMKSKEPPAATVLVTATMSKAVKRLLTYVPDLQRIEAQGFHKAVATASHSFRPLEAGSDKMTLLLELLQSDMSKGRKTIVFCSSMDSCRAVEHTMRERDIDTVCYHGEMPIQARKQSMAQFAGNHAPGSSEEAEGSGAMVMVATDVAARGLDFPGTIDHVINFDMPKTAIDYLHRAGRTARGGAKGRVTSLLQTKREREMGKAIEYALDNKMGLDQVTVTGATPPPAAKKDPDRWMPPPREKRVKGPAPIKGQKQVVQWNPDHKFIHIKNGEPIIPFKELLKGTTGDVRRKLLWEIAMDQKEWRRWRHAKAVEKRAKGRAKFQAQQRQEDAARQPQPSTPQEKWRMKVAKKQMRKEAEARGQGWGEQRGGGNSWEGRGSSRGKKSGGSSSGGTRLFKK